MTSSHAVNCDCVICYQEYLKEIIKSGDYRRYPLYDGHSGCKTDDGVKCLMLREDYTQHEKLAFDTCPCTCHYRIRLGLEAEAPCVRNNDCSKDCPKDKNLTAEGKGNCKDCVCTTRGLCECGAEGPEQTP